MMYTDATLAPFRDDEPYTAPDGTQYPAQFPKTRIPGLFPVEEAPAPDAPDTVVTGFVIDSNRKQVWQTREKTTEEQALDLKAAALSALDTSDMTAIRCFKAAVPFPQEWQDYVTALRAIVAGGEGPLPSPPPYPEGT